MIFISLQYKKQMKIAPKTKKWLTFLLQVIVAGVFIFLALRAIGGVDPVIETFSRLDPYLALLTLICPILVFFLASVNLWIILNAISPISYSLFLRNYAYSYAIGLMLPGQFGDASLTLFLRKHKIPLASSSSAYIIDKGISLILIFIFVWAGTFFILPQLNTFWYLLLPVLALSLVIIVAIVIYYIPINIKLVLKIKNAMSQTLMTMLEFRKKWHFLLINVAIALVKFGFVGLSFFLAFLCFGHPSGYFEVTIISFASSIIGYIPVSLSGIGIVEYSAINLFAWVGVSKSVVMSVYVLQRIFQYALSGMTLLIFRIMKRNHNGRANIEANE
jgi:uncharacterized membrane protein YbhN (UPF0104 family)